MLQILVLSSKFPYPLKDGGAIATFQCYEGLKQHAKKVHILSFNTTKHFVHEQDIPKDVFPDGDYTLVQIDTKPSRWGAIKNLFLSPKPYILVRFKSRSFSKRLSELLSQYSFDLVQIEGLYMLQYIEDIRKHSGAKIAFRAHNLEHQIWEQLANNSSSLLKKIYLHALSRRIHRYELTNLDRYDMLLPISKDDAEFYKNLGSKKPLKVIPSGFNFTEDRFLSLSPGLSRFFFIGSLEWKPNQEGLIWFLENCWSCLKLKLSGAELHIAGRNAPGWLIDKIGLPGIFFHGEIESSIAFMKDKDVMIVPLLSGSGMRIKIIEAFMYSKAVVATSIAAKGTNSEHGKHVRIADEPEKFVEEIINLVTNRNLFITQVEEANMMARLNFNNETIMKKLFRFYKNQVEEN